MVTVNICIYYVNRDPTLDPLCKIYINILIYNSNNTNIKSELLHHSCSLVKTNISTPLTPKLTIWLLRYDLPDVSCQLNI